MSAEARRAFQENPIRPSLRAHAHPATTKLENQSLSITARKIWKESIGNDSNTVQRNKFIPARLALMVKSIRQSTSNMQTGNISCLPQNHL